MGPGETLARARDAICALADHDQRRTRRTRRTHGRRIKRTQSPLSPQGYDRTHRAPPRRGGLAQEETAGTQATCLVGLVFLRFLLRELSAGFAGRRAMRSVLLTALRFPRVLRCSSSHAIAA